MGFLLRRDAEPFHPVAELPAPHLERCGGGAHIPEGPLQRVQKNRPLDGVESHSIRNGDLQFLPRALQPDRAPRKG